ncbi:hypothetical protein ACVNPS_03505 [Candidatus Bipolaricaulota sp. J31]
MRRYFLGFFLIVIGGLTSAQGLINPFDLEPSARAAGYGGAYCALAEGTDALIFNPAGLSWGRGMALDSGYLAQMGGLSSVIWLAGAFGPFAAAFTTLSADGIEDVPGGSALGFSHMGAAVGAGIPGDLFGFRIPALRWGVGVSIRYDRAQLADQMGSGLSLSLGALGIMPLGPWELRLGIAVEDIGFGITFADVQHRESWTMAMRAGVALVAPFATVAMDYAGGLRLGVGVRFSPMFEVRGGVAMAGAGLQFALGLGVQFNGFTLDYALLTYPIFAPSHRFGLSARF